MPSDRVGAVLQPSPPRRSALRLIAGRVSDDGAALLGSRSIATPGADSATGADRRRRQRNRRCTGGLLVVRALPKTVTPRQRARIGECQCQKSLSDTAPAVCRWGREVAGVGSVMVGRGRRGAGRSPLGRESRLDGDDR